MEGEYEKGFIYFNYSNLDNGDFGVWDEKYSTVDTVMLTVHIMLTVQSYRKY